MKYLFTRMKDETFQSVQDHLDYYTARGWKLISHNVKIMKDWEDDVHLFVWGK